MQLQKKEIKNIIDKENVKMYNIHDLQIYSKK